MKQKNRALTAILSLALLLGVPFSQSPQTIAQASSAGAAFQGVSVNFSVFNQSLSPYGNWVQTSSYGPCWRPTNIDSSWQPYYSNGHWVYTDYGWTWDSSDAWGDVTYHYGSWYDDPSEGWLWVPGYTWAPAWVTWQYTDDYVGWAPLPPSYNVSFGNGYYNNPYGYNSYQNYSYNTRPVIVNRNYYVFVPTRQFTSSQLSAVRWPARRNFEIIRRAHPVTTFAMLNGTVANPGPRVGVLEHTRPNRVAINQVIHNSQFQPQRVQLNKNRTLPVASPNVTRQAARTQQLEFKNVRQQERTQRQDQRQQTGLEQQRIQEQNRTQRQAQRQQTAVEQQRIQEQNRTQRQAQRQQTNLEQQRIQQQRQTEREQNRTNNAQRQREQDLQLQNVRQQQRVERQRSESQQQNQHQQQQRQARQQQQQQIQQQQRQQLHQQDQMMQQQRQQQRQQQQQGMQQQRQQQQAVRQQMQQQMQQRQQVQQQRQQVQQQRQQAPQQRQQAPQFQGQPHQMRRNR